MVIKEFEKFEIPGKEMEKVSGGNYPEAGDIIECPNCGFPDEARSWYSGSGECPNCGFQVID